MKIPNCFCCPPCKDRWDDLDKEEEIEKRYDDIDPEFMKSPDEIRGKKELEK